MDSSGVAFLERTVDDDQRLVVADLRKKTIEPLTSAAETVNAFDIRDRNHYVYTASDLAPLRQRREESQAAAIVGTGRSLSELLFPDDPRFASKYNYLVAVVGGKRLEVKKDGAPLVPAGDFALSPDGQSLVTKLTVPQVPVSWETLANPCWPQLGPPVCSDQPANGFGAILNGRADRHGRGLVDQRQPELVTRR
jgi:hypothetical protein